MKKYLPKLPLFILALGAILRIAGTGASAIWYDESNVLYRTGIPFLSLWTERSENSGDLILELIARPLMALSHSVWMLRLPSILAGLISLWLVWKLMRRLDFSLPQQIVASILVAFLPGLLWIAQDARVYGILACLFLAALWFALESRWMALTAVCGLIIYAHNTGPVFALAALFIALYLYPWKVRRILLVALCTAVAWIPAIIHILTSWIIQQPWQPHLTFAWFLYSATRAVWPELYPNWFFLLASVSFLAMFLLFFSRIKARGRIVPLLAWVLPVIELVAFSLITRNNAVLYRTLQPVLFPFALWLGWEFGKPVIMKTFPLSFWKSIQILLPASAWTVMLLLGFSFWHASERGGHLDLVAADIRSQWRTGDELVYTTGTVGLPFSYYLGDLPHTWDDIAKDDFLILPGQPHLTLDPPTGTPIRYWWIIPQEGLITPTEKALLAEKVQNHFPVYTVKYMQAAKIDIYLVEAK